MSVLARITSPSRRASVADSSHASGSSPAVLSAMSISRRAPSGSPAATRTRAWSSCASPSASPSSVPAISAVSRLDRALGTSPAASQALPACAR
ncbi:hypothetical protein WR25_17536 [Diploscapter pachys]|uniref:Uncharacterized protein n=1 Tax=Diploscapter pachys TaxID=2018661 RepID=A0A2A2KH15_9BILA|nr:hypothetical protein WR25_17536 [Diploscapter pachys]